MDHERIGDFLRELGRYQLEGYRKLMTSDVQVKEGGSYGLTVVTEYDIESERRTFDFLRKLHPGDSFLGEESGNVRGSPDRYWVLDPIDGTTNFTQGIAYWGPTLAFWDEMGPESGWIYMPALDQLFFARRGQGATLNGKRIHASKATEYSELVSVATTSSLHRRWRLTVPAKQRILGSLVVNLAYVATGAFVASYSRAHVWDIAAGVLLAQEAGALVESRPDLHTLRLAEIDPGSSPSLTILARANAGLPSLERFLEPLPMERPRGPAQGLV